MCVCVCVCVCVYANIVVTQDHREEKLEGDKSLILEVVRQIADKYHTLAAPEIDSKNIMIPDYD